MSLVKFTELPSGSIQGGDVLAVAGASSYKVTAVEYANWSNKRIQGNTDKTIEEVWNRAKGNSDYTTNVINPQLGQIGTNKTDIVALNGALAATNSAIAGNTNKVDNTLSRESAMGAYEIATVVRDANHIKNPAGQHIGRYWKEQTNRPPQALLLSKLAAENLEYPGWSRNGDELTYNFKVAINGIMTIGVIGGTGAFEYKINTAAWVSSSVPISVPVQYDGVAGAKVSLRVAKDFGGLAFSVTTPAIALTNTGTIDPNLWADVKNYTYDLFDKSIDLVACGYWFAYAGTAYGYEWSLGRPAGMGFPVRYTSWGFNGNNSEQERGVKWQNEHTRSAVRINRDEYDHANIFASIDPDSFERGLVGKY